MPLSERDHDILVELRTQTMEVLSSVLGSEPLEIAYLDTPRHRNLGDSLIWAGTLNYLRALGHRVVYHTDLGRYSNDVLARLPANTVVIFQGGGNMGTLYPFHEEFRHGVIARHPHRKFVVMPQSLHYSAQAAEREAAEAYGLGRDVTLLVREHRSEEIALRSFRKLNVTFCPDAAFGAELEAWPQRERNRILILSRTDDEVDDLDRNGLNCGVDWAWSALNSWKWTVNHLPGAIIKRLPGVRPDWLTDSLMHFNEKLLELNVAAAFEQFNGVQAVVTNRLHAHILSTLLGIPNFVSDNIYGKISAVYESYSSRFSTGTLTSSLQEALICLREEGIAT